MAGSVNKVVLIGRLGSDPDIRQFSSGDKIANLSLATSESWKDKSTGERKERTEWHRIVVKNKGLVTVCENYLKKGAQIYVEGQLQTRSWEKDGQKQYATEVILAPFNSTLAMLDSRQNSTEQSEPRGEKYSAYDGNPDELEDEISF